MNNKQINTLINNRTQDITDIALDLSQDRRVLLDFVETCAVTPNKLGKYTHSRDEIQIKAKNILNSLHCK